MMAAAATVEFARMGRICALRVNVFANPNVRKVAAATMAVVGTATYAASVNAVQTGVVVPADIVLLGRCAKRGCVPLWMLRCAGRKRLLGIGQ